MNIYEQCEGFYGIEYSGKYVNCRWDRISYQEIPAREDIIKVGKSLYKIINVCYTCTDTEQYIHVGAHLIEG